MVFSENWGAAAAATYFVIAIVLLIITLFFADPRGPLRPIIGKYVVAFLVVATIANSFVFFVGKGSGSQREATVTEVVQSFGLNSGASYPLVLGSRITGSSGDMKVSSGLFSFSANTTITPASATTISFEHNNTSYMLELPTSKLTFVQSSSEKPSVRLYLLNGDVDYVTGSNALDANNPDNAVVNRTFSPCQVVINSFLVTCVRQTLSTEVVIGSNITRRGLAPIVLSNFDSAVITLTPVMYKQLLGR